jgi:hypothetical protein
LESKINSNQTPNSSISSSISVPNSSIKTPDSTIETTEVQKIANQIIQQMEGKDSEPEKSNNKRNLNTNVQNQNPVSIIENNKRIINNRKPNPNPNAILINRNLEKTADLTPASSTNSVRRRPSLWNKFFQSLFP